VLAAGEAEGVADEVQHTGLGHRQRPGVPDGVGEAFEAVADHDADVIDATVLDLGEHTEPAVLGCSSSGCPGATGGGGRCRQ
jgi:hypothetical protein